MVMPHFICPLVGRNLYLSTVVDGCPEERHSEHLLSSLCGLTCSGHRSGIAGRCACSSLPRLVLLPRPSIPGYILFPVPTSQSLVLGWQAHWLPLIVCPLC